MNVSGYRIRTEFRDNRGVIRIIYDFERTRSRQILMAVFTEDDVRSGKPSAKARFRVQVNQAGPAGR